MKVNEITENGETYRVGDYVVFNTVSCASNEFNGMILGIQTRKNSRYPIVTVVEPGEDGLVERMKSYCLIRKGKDGKGIDLYWD